MGSGRLKVAKIDFLFCDVSLDARQTTAIPTTTVNQATNNDR